MRGTWANQQGLELGNYEDIPDETVLQFFDGYIEDMFNKRELEEENPDD